MEPLFPFQVGLMECGDLISELLGARNVQNLSVFLSLKFNVEGFLAISP
jgi:hypothetical protein